MTRHALPVAWDGHPILWEDRWHPLDGFHICRPTLRYVCENCHMADRTRMLRGDVTGPVVRTLALFRCMACGYSTITDLGADGWHEWILDDSDYEAAGSYEETK